MKKKTLFSLLMMFVSLTSWSQTIRLHATYPEYNKRQGNGSAGITVPSDNKTDWAEGDMIFFTIDGGDAEKGFKATYDGATWTFAEWYKNGGMQDFNPAGGTISFAMNGDNLNLATMRPSNLDVSKTALQVLSSYAGGKLGDIMFDKAGTYTVDENGDIDIYLNFTRPMAKIHINGAYLAATQIRNQIEGTMPGGVDNAGGTNANYNKSKTMTLGQIVRYQPSTQTFRDAISGNSLNGTANMVYMTRPEDMQVIDAVYYGNMEPDENGDMTIVMCTNARTYPGIEANAALGNNGQVAYWRKFPGMTINPNDDIYIYGPLSEEEGHLWTSQAITAAMNFTSSQLTLAENQQIALKPLCKWKAPAPKDRTLTFEISNPNIISISEDGDTLYTHGVGTSTITATTIDGYSSTMMVNVKDIQELIDVSQSTWGSSYSSNNVGWIFRNNTTADLTVTRVVMMALNASGDYEEVASSDGLNLLARSNNGTAYSTLNIKEDNIKDLPTSKLRISYVYNGKAYSVDIPFTDIWGDTSAWKFVETYDSESTAEGWKNLVKERYTPAILNRYNNYFLSVNQNERSTGTVVTGTILSGKAKQGEDFTLTFDMCLGSSGGGQYAQYPTSVSFMDATNSDIMFSLVAKGPATGITGPGWKVNNTDLEVDLPNSGYTYTDISQITWCSYRISRWKGLTFVTITNRESGETILPRQTVEGASIAGGLGNIIADLKRYRSNFAIDNIVLRDVIYGDVPNIAPTTYILRYRNENGEEIKSDSTIVSYIGADVAASPMQLHPIIHNSQKYIYNEGNDTIKLTGDATSNVITLTYRKAPVYSYTVNATNSDGEILKTIKVSSGFEGDDLIIPYPTYIVKDEKMWSTYVAYKEYREHVTLTQDNQVFNIIYKETNADNVIYYAEAEDVEGMTRYSAGNSEVRSSQAAMGYAEHDVKFTTLEPGNYQLSFVLYTPMMSTIVGMTFVAGDYTFTNSGTGDNYLSKTFDVFTLTEPTDLILKQGGDQNCGVDLVYIQRIEGEPQYIAQLNAADSTLTFKKGIITNTGYYRGWEVSNTGGKAPGWYSYRQYISKVVFDKSFAEARPKTCSNWFSQHYNLKLISGMENLNTSEVTDMSAMFYNCYNLQKLDVSHFNTSEVTDMGWMFMGCSSLSNLDLSNFDTKKVTRMKSMFNMCYWLESLDISHLNTSNVTDMSFMFNECESLTSLDVSHFNTSNVTDMTEMFRYCTNLTTIDVSNFDTSNAQKLGWLFCGCFSLEDVDVSHFKTDKATIMTSMFWNCRSLKDIDVTSFNTENVTSMGWMFVGCSALKTLNLSSFNTKNVSEIKFMLANCTDLTKVYVSKDWDMTNVTAGDSIFLNCENLIGGMGTRYDVNYIDKSYACIDGGIDAPGYFTDITADALRGDVNGDGIVNGTDIQAIINLIVDGEYDAKADVNEDEEVNGTDIQEVINIIIDN